MPQSRSNSNVTWTLTLCPILNQSEPFLTLDSDHPLPKQETRILVPKLILGRGDNAAIILIGHLGEGAIEARPREIENLWEG